MSKIERYLLLYIKWMFQRAHRQYLIATAYYRHIGVQTPSANYGGSRSFIYLELIERADTVRDVWAARSRYHSLHLDPSLNRDESGAVLRIVGYYMRDIPKVGKWFERKVRASDALMVAAAFNYPPDCKRVTAPVDDIS